MTATAVRNDVDDSVATDTIYDLPVRSIHPDPNQPRLEVDDDLAASIKEQGVLQHITVRPHPVIPDEFQLVDGERRWKGAKKAGLATIPAKITFDVEGVSVAARMKRQIVHNSGKPLTPIEEAIAFKKIIDDERAGGNKKYGATHLAKDIGYAKSTVTDRLATMEIPAFWLKLIVGGPLQPSHVPALHRWRKLPEKFQLRGLEKMKNDWKWPGVQRFGSRGPAKDDRLYIGDFENMLTDAMRSYVKPVGEVPGYKGPTERMVDTRGYPRTTKTFAMDPAIWQPIARKKSAERRKKNASKAGGGGSQQSKWEKEDAERRERYRAQQAREDRSRKAINAARPKLLAAFQAAVDGAKFATLRDLVVAEALGHGTPKTFAQAARKANTAEAVLRALAMADVAAQLHSQYSAVHNLTKLAKRWKVDAAKLIKADAEEPEEKAPDPATTDPGEAGDGRLAVDLDEEDEGGDA